MLSSLATSEPSLDTFVTLSPVPGFGSWLEARLARHTPTRGAADSVATGGRAGHGADEAAALDALLSALTAAGLSPAEPFEELGALHQADCGEVGGRDEGDGGDGGRGDGASRTSSGPGAPLLVAVRRALLVLCARYLCLATQRQRALDPVAAFHLRNGATLSAIHWGANPSARGVRESSTIMVNYLYEPSQIELNHSAYVSNGHIAATESVWAMVNGYRVNGAVA